jgi:hypothetical protein
MMIPQPGAIGFAHSNGLMAKCIRVGEFLRFRKGSKWNHMVIVSDEVSTTGEYLAIQATLRGVTSTVPLSEVAPGGEIQFLELPDGVDAEKVLTFAKSQVGLEYGYFTILAIALDICTWNWVPSFRGARKQSWICSALAMESLRFGGFLHDMVDIYSITPAESYLILSGITD